MVCDDNLASDHDGWYRFEGAAGIMMATHCIPIQSCNSHMAGWIGGGDHPSSAYQKVTRTAYMHYGSSCEHVAYPGTEIRNCSGFYVYKLQSVNGCYQRYCGVNGKCHIKNIRFFFLKSCTALSSFSVNIVHQPCVIAGGRLWGRSLLSRPPRFQCCYILWSGAEGVGEK